MNTLKTTVNEANITSFLNNITDENKKRDSFVLLTLFSKITGEEPKMWGTSIIGFGSYHYKSQKSKQEGDWLLTGFSPRKQNLTIYIISGFDGYADLLKNLGKHKTSVGCLYINKLADVDITILEQIIRKSFVDMKERNNTGV